MIPGAATGSNVHKRICNSGMSERRKKTDYLSPGGLKPEHPSSDSENGSYTHTYRYSFTVFHLINGIIWRLNSVSWQLCDISVNQHS